jgi:hypothetical protein
LNVLVIKWFTLEIRNYCQALNFPIVIDQETACQRASCIVEERLTGVILA